MVGIHWQHKAILLRNGQVLIVGGYGGDLKRSSTTELYDPAAGTWAKSTTMIPLGSAHSATLLPSGKVLIAGGTVELPAFYPLAIAELYDVGLGFNNSWQP